MTNNKWFLEPISWQQADAIAKHYGMSKQEAALVYPTKGDALGAIKASIFRECLAFAIKSAIAGRLTKKEQVRGYFVDDSEGGQNNLGKRDINLIWDYLKGFIKK